MTGVDTPDTRFERPCGRNVDGIEPSFDVLLVLAAGIRAPEIAPLDALGVARRQPRLLTLRMRHGVERSRYRLHDTTGDDLCVSEHPVQVKGWTRQLQVRPLLPLLYGPCRYGTRTSQNRLKSLRSSGCGPWSPDTVSEIGSPSPTGSFGSPVYS